MSTITPSFALNIQMEITMPIILKQSTTMPIIPLVNMELIASTSLVNRETTTPDSLEEKNLAFIFSSFSAISTRISLVTFCPKIVIKASFRKSKTPINKIAAI